MGFAKLKKKQGGGEISILVPFGGAAKDDGGGGNDHGRRLTQYYGGGGDGGGGVGGGPWAHSGSARGGRMSQTEVPKNPTEEILPRGKVGGVSLLKSGGGDIMCEEKEAK